MLCKLLIASHTDAPWIGSIDLFRVFCYSCWNYNSSIYVKVFNSVACFSPESPTTQTCSKLIYAVVQL